MFNKNNNLLFLSFVNFTRDQLLNLSFHIGHFRRRWNNYLSSFFVGIRHSIFILNLDYFYFNFNRILLFCAFVFKHYGRVISYSNISSLDRGGVGFFLMEKSRNLFYDGPYIGGLVSNVYTLRMKLKKRIKLNQMIFHNLNKIQNKLPDFVLVFNTNKFYYLIKEAVDLGLPSLSVVDSDMDLLNCTYFLIGNSSSLFFVFYVIVILSFLKKNAIRIRFLNYYKARFYLFFFLIKMKLILLTFCELSRKLSYKYKNKKVLQNFISFVLFFGKVLKKFGVFGFFDLVKRFFFRFIMLFNDFLKKKINEKINVNFNLIQTLNGFSSFSINRVINFFFDLNVKSMLIIKRPIIELISCIDSMMGIKQLLYIRINYLLYFFKRFRFRLKKYKMVFYIFLKKFLNNSVFFFYKKKKLVYASLKENLMFLGDKKLLFYRLLLYHKKNYMFFNLKKYIVLLRFFFARKIFYKRFYGYFVKYVYKFLLQKKNVRFFFLRFYGILKQVLVYLSNKLLSNNKLFRSSAYNINLRKKRFFYFILNKKRFFIKRRVFLQVKRKKIIRRFFLKSNYVELKGKKFKILLRKRYFFLVRLKNKVINLFPSSLLYYFYLKSRKNLFKKFNVLSYVLKAKFRGKNNVTLFKSRKFSFISRKSALIFYKKNKNFSFFDKIVKLRTNLMQIFWNYRSFLKSNFYVLLYNFYSLFKTFSYFQKRKFFFFIKRMGNKKKKTSIFFFKLRNVYRFFVMCSFNVLKKKKNIYRSTILKKKKIKKLNWRALKFFLVRFLLKNNIIIVNKKKKVYKYKYLLILILFLKLKKNSRLVLFNNKIFSINMFVYYLILYKLRFYNKKNFFYMNKKQMVLLKGLIKKKRKLNKIISRTIRTKRFNRLRRIQKKIILRKFILKSGYRRVRKSVLLKYIKKKKTFFISGLSLKEVIFKYMNGGRKFVLYVKNLLRKRKRLFILLKKYVLRIHTLLALANSKELKELEKAKLTYNNNYLSEYELSKQFEKRVLKEAPLYWDLYISLVDKGFEVPYALREMVSKYMISYGLVTTGEWEEEFLNRLNLKTRKEFVELREKIELFKYIDPSIANFKSLDEYRLDLVSRAEETYKLSSKTLYSYNKIKEFFRSRYPLIIKKYKKILKRLQKKSIRYKLIKRFYIKKEDVNIYSYKLKSFFNMYLYLKRSKKLAFFGSTFLIKSFFGLFFKRYLRLYLKWKNKIKIYNFFKQIKNFFYRKRLISRKFRKSGGIQFSKRFHFYRRFFKKFFFGFSMVPRVYKVLFLHFILFRNRKELFHSFINTRFMGLYYRFFYNKSGRLEKIDIKNYFFKKFFLKKKIKQIFKDLFFLAYFNRNFLYRYYELRKRKSKLIKISKRKRNRGSYIKMSSALLSLNKGQNFDKKKKNDLSTIDKKFNKVVFKKKRKMSLRKISFINTLIIKTFSLLLFSRKNLLKKKKKKKGVKKFNKFYKKNLKGKSFFKKKRPYNI